MDPQIYIKVPVDILWGDYQKSINVKDAGVRCHFNSKKLTLLSRCDLKGLITVNYF